MSSPSNTTVGRSTGMLPAGWKRSTLESLLTVSIGGIWGEEHGQSEVDVDVVRVTELRSHGDIEQRTAAKRSITKKQFQSRALEVGDLLLEKSGGGPNTPVGRVGYVSSVNSPTVCSNFMQLMRPDTEKVLPTYLHLFLTFLHSNGETIPLQTSTTNIRNIKTSEYMAINVPVTSPSEQVKIVGILEEQFSRLDAALASVRAVRQKSARFRRSLLHAAFTGELSGQKIATGTLPDGWRRGTIEQVADVVTGRTPTKFEQRLERSVTENRNVPFYKVGDMNSAAQYLKAARVYFAESEANSFGIEILPSGTVIFPKAGGAIATNKKRVLEVPGAIDLNCMGVSGNGALLPKLLFWFFESFNLSSIADGSVLPQIGKKRVAKIEICFPESKSEQIKLLEDIESSISNSDAVERMSEAIEKKSSALRRSLLYAAFSGNLTREWREGAHV